jgi:hypothetical protein
MNWLTQYFFGDSYQPRWISILILFYDEGELHLDKGYVVSGKMSKDSLGYYCNLSNFTVIDQRLFYFYKNGIIKRIDPSKVMIHLKFGKGIVNPKDWSAFFSSPKNEFLKFIEKDLSSDKIKVVEIVRNVSNSLKVSNCEHPLFKKKQIYGHEMDQVILSDLIISYL